MNRREFIPKASLLAALPYLEKLKSFYPQPRHLIALGTSATSLSLMKEINGGFDKVTIVTDSCFADTNNKIEYIEFMPPDSVYSFFEGYKFLKKEPFQMISLPRPLREVLANRNGKAVIFAAFGKYTGTVLSNAIAQEFKGDRNLHFVNTIPFSFEGSYVQEQSRLVAAKVSSTHSCRTFELDEIRHRYGNLAVRSAFMKADLELARLLLNNFGE